MAEKLYYSMGEVAEMFDVNQSLIRHWESQFSVLRPKRNKKGNRLFTPQDVENLKRIYHLVKECGMTLEGAKRAMRRQPADDAADRSGELLERLQRIRALLVEVREDLKAADGEIVAVGDDYGAESPAETPASAPVSAERPAAAGSLAPDTPPAVSADDAATPAAEASQAGIPDTETPARRRNRAVVKIDEAAGAPSGAESPADGAPGAARRPVRKPRRKKEEPEHKELFAFYEQSLF